MSTSSLITVWQTEWNDPPPASCSNLAWPSYARQGMWGEGCDGGHDLSCYPWDSLSTFSPVTACPSGWGSFSAEATVSEKGAEGELIFQCCPDGYEYSMVRDLFWCIASEAGTFLVRSCDNGSPELSRTVLASGDLQKASAYPLQLRYKESDLTAPNSASASTTGDGPSNGAATTTPPGNRPPNSRPSKKSGLSLGVKAAIGVVIPLLLLACIAILSFFYKRKKRAQQQGTGPQSGTNEGYGKAELSGGEVYAPIGADRGGNFRPYPEKPELSANHEAVPGGQHTRQWNDQVVMTPAELGDTPKFHGPPQPSENAFNSGVEQPRAEDTITPPGLPVTQAPQELSNNRSFAEPFNTRSPVEPHSTHNIVELGATPELSSNQARVEPQTTTTSRDQLASHVPDPMSTATGHDEVQVPGEPQGSVPAPPSPKKTTTTVWGW